MYGNVTASRGRSGETLSSSRQSLPGLQHSRRPAALPTGNPEAPHRPLLPPQLSPQSSRLLRGDDAASGSGGHDGVMITARTASPGLSAPPFSSGPEQYVDGLPPGFVFPGTENLDPAEIFSGPGYTAPHPRTDSGATAAMVCGLLSFIPVVGVVAIVLGAGALRRLRRSYDSGEGMAWLGLILGGASTIIWLFVLVLVLFMTSYT